jgi:hypothetical protein
LNSNRYAPRVAGFSFLFLIATGLAGPVMWSGVRTTRGISDTLASISENSGRVRFSLVLVAVAGLTTVVLAAMLYATVKHQDRNLAILALSLRTVEAGLSTIGMFDTLVLLSLSQGSSKDAPSVQVMADLLMNVRWMGTNIGAIFFAAGSTLYCYLLLKARSIPVPLAALGVVGSLLILVGVPWQTALSHQTFSGASAVIWFPIGIFEIIAGVWLMVKGANVPTTAPAEHAGTRPR